MKQISIFFSALIIFVLGISNAWALPNCPSSGYFHNCFGTYTWDDGAKYVGEWQNDKSHGQGTHTWANGDKYVGEWQNDNRTGQGTYTWGDGEWAGDKYVGEFKNDLRHCRGTYTYANGRKDI